MIKADLIALADETYDESQPLLLFDPVETWKKTLMEPGEYSMREIMVKVFDKGECLRFAKCHGHSEILQTGAGNALG